MAPDSVLQNELDRQPFVVINETITTSFLTQSRVDHGFPVLHFFSEAFSFLTKVGLTAAVFRVHIFQGSAQCEAKLPGAERDSYLRSRFSLSYPIRFKS
jgi:hypothetical protein